MASGHHVGKQKSGFYWKSDTLSGPLRTFPAKVERAIVAAVEYHATRAERYARTNAPWTDRTSNARNGLFVVTEHVPFKTHKLTLAHTVEYGIWLEVKQAGKYAIILPTIEKTGPEVMQTLSKLFSSPGIRLFK